MGRDNPIVTLPKLIRVTTVGLSLNLLLKNQLKMLSGTFEVVALSSPGDDLDLVGRREEVRTIGIPMKREISLIHDLVSLVRLILAFLRERPAIVHANTPKGSLLAMIAAYVCQVPVRLYTITGLRYETETGFKRKVLIWMERVTCAFSSSVIAESEGVRQLILRDHLTQKHVNIIGNGNLNGIDSEYWDPSQVDGKKSSEVRNRLGIGNLEFLFIFIGRLVRDKGVNELIRAFNYLDYNNCKLLLVGPFEHNLDPLDPQILNEINTNPDIISVGYQSDVRLFLSISNALVLPSYREGFPNVILQAGAMGIPSICTDVNGAVEVINDRKNGMIVQKRDVAALKDAMSFVRNNYNAFDPDVCRNYVVDRFAQSTYYPLLLSFYKSLL